MEQGQKTGQSVGQNGGKQAPMRRGIIRSLPSLPQPAGPQGITFSRFALCMGGAVVLAALGWAYFMGYMVGRGDNPREQVEEATAFLRPNSEGKGDRQETTPQPTAEMASTGQLGQSGQPGQAALQEPQPPSTPAACGPSAAATATPSFDPHARPQGESLAAWGNQRQATPAATGVVAGAAASTAPTAAQKTATQQGKKPQPVPAKAQTVQATKGPKYAFTYQMGAFKNKPAAEALQKQMAAKGRRGTVSKSGNVFLVTFLVKGTEDEARAARQALEKQGLGKALLISRRPL